MPTDAQPFPEHLAHPDESTEALDTDDRLDRYEGQTDERPAGSSRRPGEDDGRGGPQPGGSAKHDGRSR